MEATKLRIGISMGDVGGIGPELVLKVFSDARMLRQVVPVLYGSAKALNQYINLYEYTKFSFQVISTAQQAAEAKLNLVECAPELTTVEPGKPSAAGGKAAFQALELASADLKAGHLAALVTLPIDKFTLQQPGFNFPGHTEYLAAKFGAQQNLMLMVYEQLRVALVTGHLPLKEVPAALSTELIFSKLKLFSHSLQQDFGITRPQIAILGLNPHAGDNGLLGGEEASLFPPLRQLIEGEELLAFGPYPADGFFANGAYRQFDGILALYHDQGLIPFKLLCGGHGVNFTAGLPAIRTSPDHGTAYDIAGKHLADETSFRNAIYLAQDVYRSRMEHVALAADALKKAPLPAHLRPSPEEAPRR